jgi:hypothetical protein
MKQETHQEKNMKAKKGLDSLSGSSNSSWYFNSKATKHLLVKMKEGTHRKKSMKAKKD